MMNIVWIDFKVQVQITVLKTKVLHVFRCVDEHWVEYQKNRVTGDGKEAFIIKLLNAGLDTKLVRSGLYACQVCLLLGRGSNEGH